MKYLPPYYFSFSDFGIEKGPLSNPAESARRALDSYNSYINSGSKESKSIFSKYIIRLVDSFVFSNDFGVWPYRYLFRRARLYGCRIPWVSGLAQGLGISALLRAYSLDENDEYFKIAKYALGAFKTPMKKGGVLYVDQNDGHWWYEEFASASSCPSGVLNGLVIALLGAYDLYLFSGDPLAKQLFDRGISTLSDHISDFDSKYPYKLTYYDRYKHVVSIEYHLLHTKMMDILHKITKKEIFRRYEERWEMYKEKWYAHRIHRLLSRIYQMKSGLGFRDFMAFLTGLF